MCLKHNITPYYLLVGIAASLLFNDQTDTNSQEVYSYCKQNGAAATLKKYGEFENENLTAIIQQFYDLLVNKDIKIVIYFEKERMYSNDPRTEMIFTMLSSFAQEESRSISQNVTYGYRMKFKTGTAKIRTSYGYTSDSEGGLEIVSEEATVVKKAFKYYLDGYSTQEIAKMFNAEGIPTRTKKSSWCGSVILNWLSNEKYVGDTIFQKIYTVDFLTHKQVKNNGEIDSYFLENTHEPIISKEEFAVVQAELKRRIELRGNTETEKSKCSGKYAFSNMLFCSKCNGRLHRHSYEVKDEGEGKYVRTWVCQSKRNKDYTCSANYEIPEKSLEQAFVATVNDFIKDDAILKDIEQLATNSEQNCLIKFRIAEMKEFLLLKNSIIEFDRSLFHKLVHHVVVYSRNEVEFIFYSGHKHKVLAPITKTKRQEKYEIVNKTIREKGKDEINRKTAGC